MEGRIVPKNIRKAAKRMHDYLASDGADYSYEGCCEKLLKTIASAPIALRKANPNICVRYEYENYRQGSFEEECICMLASYILIMTHHASTGDGVFCYNDRVGKHSSVEVAPEEFEASWTTKGLVDKDKGDWSWLKSTRFELHQDGRLMLWDACLEWLRNRKPEGYLVEDDDIPDHTEFIATFYAVYERIPYIVKLTFSNVYKTHKMVRDALGFSVNVFKEEFASHTIEFMDPRVAAAFYVLQLAFHTRVTITDAKGKSAMVVITAEPSKLAPCYVTLVSDMTSVESHPWMPPADVQWQTWPQGEGWFDLVERAKANLKK